MAMIWRACGRVLTEHSACDIDTDTRLGGGTGTGGCRRVFHAATEAAKGSARVCEQLGEHLLGEEALAALRRVFRAGFRRVSSGFWVRVLGAQGIGQT